MEGLHVGQDELDKICTFVTLDFFSSSLFNFMLYYSVFYVHVRHINPTNFWTGRPKYKDPNFLFWLLPLSVLIVFTLQAVLAIAKFFLVHLYMYTCM